MKRTILILALLALSAPAMACMGILIRTDFLGGGVACTYRLNDGSTVRLIYPGEYVCQPCLQ
jgi:hypothetical protein